MSHSARSAPHPLTARTGRPLKGSLSVPGDKSISHRALMLGGLAVGTTRITGLLEGEDVLATAEALRRMGCHVVQRDAVWEVTGRGTGALVEPADVLDLGNAGTATRLLMGIVAAHPFTAIFTGDASLRSRPMLRVLAPLEQMGARWIGRSGGRLPLALTGRADLLPILYRLPVASAQVKSAVLLAGLHAPGATSTLEAEPTRDHTENMLRHFGATVTVEDTAEGRLATVTGESELIARDVIVPADPSSAAFPVVAACLVPGSAVTVTNVGLNPLRTGFLTSLREMGADITVTNARTEGGEPVGDLVVKAASLRGADIPADRAPSQIDEYPILAVAAACADGTTRLRGLAELRVKESDRLEAVASELTACGVRLEIEGDDLIIHGTGKAPSGGATVHTRLDHRIAMSFLVLGLVSEEPIAVDDARPIETSFPGFAALLNGLGANIA